MLWAQLQWAGSSGFRAVSWFSFCTNSVADKTQRCLVKACSRPFDLHEPSHNTHTPKHSGPIDADREGSMVVVRRVTERVKERQKYRQTGRERERHWACSRLVLLLPLGNRAWRTISSRRENSGSAISHTHKYTVLYIKSWPQTPGWLRWSAEETKKAHTMKRFAFKRKWWLNLSCMRPVPRSVVI